LSISEDINVVLVDWSILAASPWYETAAGNTRPTGEFIGDFINFLISRGVVQRSDVHILGTFFSNFLSFFCSSSSSLLKVIFVLGHSLGSHVAGFAQSTMTSGRPARITGKFIGTKSCAYFLKSFNFFQFLIF